MEMQTKYLNFYFFFQIGTLFGRTPEYRMHPTVLGLELGQESLFFKKIWIIPQHLVLSAKSFSKFFPNFKVTVAS